jgi:hypothetical protein
LTAHARRAKVAGDPILLAYEHHPPSRNPSNRMALLVMLNNYLHDLATAVFAVSAVTAYLLRRSLAMRGAPEIVRPVVRGVVRVGIASLIWTLLFGFVRGLTYREYEWVEAAGRDQVPALVAKHVILVCLVIAGCVVLYRLYRLGPVPEQVRVGSGD